MKKYIALLCGALLIVACKEKKPDDLIEDVKIIAALPVILFGYNFDDYNVIQDTIKKGESFLHSPQ